MVGIRVTYSGLITFGIRLITIFTGLIFTVIVTRQLSIEEFGTWGLINGIIVYALIINPIVSYWVTREIARGEKTAKTALVSSSVLSTGGILIYLLAAYIVGIQSGADLSILFFSVILVPIIFIKDCLNAIVIGQKPHATSYGLLVFEITKIFGGLFFVYLNELGLEGAIMAIFLAYATNTIILAFYTKNQLRTRFQKKYLLKWVKLFWLPTYRKIPGLIQMSDVVVFSIMTGSVVGIAYFTAARTIGMLVHNVGGLSQGLYPKLLESEKQEFLQENLIKLFYFAFPLTAFSIIFAQSGLFVLNPVYQVAAPIVIFISLRTFLRALNKVFFAALQGMEVIDKDKHATFKEYTRSKLVWIPTFDLVRHVAYIGILALLLFVFSSQTDNILDLVLYWSVIGFVVEIPLILYIIHLVKKSFTLKIDKTSILKYLLASIIVFGSVGIIMEEYLEYKESIFEFFPSLMVFIFISVLGYLGITFLIDRRTKVMFKAIWNEYLK